VFIQFVLEEEITEVLGRHKSERRRTMDDSPAYRNGYGKERKLTLGCGTITLHRPRVRRLEGRFESWVLPLFARRAKEVSKLIPQLYLHGLALGDFDLALRGGGYWTRMLRYRPALSQGSRKNGRSGNSAVWQGFR
jgi:transposase-like protein